MKDWNLLLAAESAKKAYDEPLQTINETGISYSCNGGILYISYSGTQNSSDVISNLSIIPNFRGCHSGFYDRAKELLIPTMNIIDAYQSARGLNIQIIICSHSLGGAIAQIICKLLKNQYKNLMCITFGSPKVWIRLNNPKINHIRVEHIDDPVPKLLPFLYQHYQTEARIIGQDKLFVSINAHLIETYIQELEE